MNSLGNALPSEFSDVSIDIWQIYSSDQFMYVFYIKKITLKKEKKLTYYL